MTDTRNSDRLILSGGRPQRPSQLDRIEQKLDILIAALAEDQVDQDEQHHLVSLDGETIPAGDRDQTQSLG